MLILKRKLREKPHIIFDAGGTTLFPDQKLLIELSKEHGLNLTSHDCYSGYYHLIHNLDMKARQKGSFPEDPWPKGYAYYLFKTLGMSARAPQSLTDEILARHKQRNLWTFTFDWVISTLHTLRSKGYRISVLSNSDGRARKIFSDLKFDNLFDEIFDSQILGVSKPNPGIFKQALTKLKIESSQAIYVGDICEVDVKGANSAGIGAIHIDPLNLYRGQMGEHIKDISDLPNWLDQYCDCPVSKDIYPYLTRCDDVKDKRLFENYFVYQAERRFQGREHLPVGLETLQPLENVPSR